MLIDKKVRYLTKFSFSVLKMNGTSDSKERKTGQSKVLQIATIAASKKKDTDNIINFFLDSRSLNTDLQDILLLKSRQPSFFRGLWFRALS